MVSCFHAGGSLVEVRGGLKEGEDTLMCGRGGEKAGRRGGGQVLKGAARDNFPGGIGPLTGGREGGNTILACPCSFNILYPPPPHVISPIRN